MRILEGYLRDRTLLYDADDGRHEKRLTAGTAKGLILGPNLWNVSYDDLLRLEMP